MTTNAYLTVCAAWASVVASVPMGPVYTNEILDDFNRPGTGLGPNWTLYGDIGMALTANAYITTPANTFDRWARWNTAVSSANHYASITRDIVSPSAPRWYGPCVRMSSDGTTFYSGVWDGQIDAWRIYKWASSTATALATASAVDPGTGVYRLDVVGNDLTLFFNGVEVLAITDSSLAGNTYVGMYALHASQMDNFDAGTIS